jgi:hypothetical protein
VRELRHGVRHWTASHPEWESVMMRAATNGAGLTQNMTREQVVETLQRLLERPVGLALSAHGAPADRGALERALA